MKTKQFPTNSKHTAFGRRSDLWRGNLRRVFRPRQRVHDPMLVLNMSTFNFTDGWSGTFSKYEDAQFYL
jgi:hypothetical protein